MAYEPETFESVRDRESMTETMTDTMNDTIARVRHGIEDAVKYVRERDVRRIAEDVKDYARANPVQALIGAAVVGFVAGRILRRS